MNSSKVIVIGGGIAGLVAAYFLQSKGLEVIVLEASSRVGGRMISDHSKGYLIDGGAQFLSSDYQILSSLIEELGMNSEYMETSPSMGIVRDGKIRKFKNDKPLSLLSGGLLSVKEWLLLGIGSFSLSRKAKGLPVNDYSAWTSYDDKTAESWSNDIYGTGVTEYLTEPMLEAFYFQSPSETSRALTVAINEFAVHGAKTKTLLNGMGSLPDRIADIVDVRLDSPVNSLYIKPDRVTVSTRTQRIESCKVILATPAHISKGIYPPRNLVEKELLDTTYSSTINIAIALTKRLPKEIGLNDIYGVWIPRPERELIAAFTIETNKDSGRAVDGELIHVMLSGEGGKAMIKKEESFILERILDELERYLPSIKESIAFTKIYRWKNAEPTSPVGRSKSIFEYRKSITKDDKVILAGDYMGMPFTEGAAETGHWAASSILKML